MNESGSLVLAAIAGLALGLLACSVAVIEEVQRDCELLGKTHIGNHVLVCEVKS